MSTNSDIPMQQKRTAWLYAGLLAFVPHLAAVIYVAAQRPGYSHGSQFLSELGERGAPGAGVANYLGIAPTGLLFLLFGSALAWHCREQRALLIAGALVAVHGVCRMVAAFFVCDVGCRPAAPSASQLVHNGAASLGFVALTAAVFTGAAWLVRKRGDLPTILGSYMLGAVAVVSQALLLLQHSGPTGLYQRVALGALQLWVSLFAAYLLVRSRNGA